MVITYFGKEFFKVQLGDLVIALNPISKKSKLPQSRFGAEIALISLNHDDFNGVENVSYGEKVPFVVNGPGEYEVKEVNIEGFQTEGSYGKKNRLNTVYQIKLEQMNLCFLGVLNSADLPAKVKEELDDIDILFVPVGGETLSPEDAAKLANKLEPKIVIPMDYEDEKTLKEFLSEMGETPERLEKLTLKRKDLEGKEGDVVVLKASI